jgi:hypothetical protein
MTLRMSLQQSKMIVAIIIAGFLLTSGYVSSAHAASPPTVNGMGSSTAKHVPTASEQALLQEKTVLAQNAVLARQGKISYATYLAQWQSFAHKHHLSTKNTSLALRPSTCPFTVGIQPMVNCQRYSNSLGVTQEPQYTPNYCGDATVEEMLLYLGWSYGPNGENLYASPFPGAGQDTLAYNYLGGPNGTDYWAWVVPSTLNSWTRSSFYTQVDASAMAMTTFEDYVTTDIDVGYPVAFGIHEDSGTPHLNGHATDPYLIEMNHWVAGTGYTGYGATITYDDSISGVPANWYWGAPHYPPVPATSSVPTSSVMWPLIQNYGIVW